MVTDRPCLCFSWPKGRYDRKPSGKQKQKFYWHKRSHTSVQNNATKPNRPLSNTSPRTHKCLRSCWANLHFWWTLLSHMPNLVLTSSWSAPHLGLKPGGDVAAFFSPPTFNPSVMNPLLLISSLIQLECSLCGRCSNCLPMKPVCIILQEESATGLHSCPGSFCTLLLPAQP